MLTKLEDNANKYLMPSFRTTSEDNETPKAALHGKLTVSLEDNHGILSLL